MQENDASSLKHLVGLKAIWCSTDLHSVIFPLSLPVARDEAMNLAL